MISRAFLFLLFLPLSALADNGTVCLQTFNVYGPAYASHTTDRLTRLGEYLAQDPCDAIQFQELWKEDQFNILNEKLTPARLAGIWADHLRADGKKTGLGSFFAGNVLKAESILFQLNNGSDPLDEARRLLGVEKGFTLMEVKLDNRPPFLFVNVHTHPTDQDTRVAQMLQLILAVYADPRSAAMPVMMTGDLNATPTGPELELLESLLLLRDGYAEAHDGSGDACTYCGNNRYSWTPWKNRVIDFTLYRPTLTMGMSAESSEINLQGDGNPYSDHYGVRSHFHWEDRSAAPLANNDPIVQARLERAEKALEAASRALAGESSDAGKAAAQSAATLLQQFQAGQLPAAMQAAFLVP